MLRSPTPGQERREFSAVPPIPSSPPARFQQGREETQKDLEGLYIISVAARLLDMHPQTLRKYERRGLVSPSRTEGMLRLYSRADLVRIRLIRHLEETLGLNLAGVYMALDLLDRMTSLRDRLFDVGELDRLREAVEEEMDWLFRQFGLSAGEQKL